MMQRANSGFGLRALNRAFAGAVAVIAATSCGGDALGPKDIAAVRFVTQPSSLTAGTQFSVSVELVASGNRRVTGATDAVTLTVAGGSTLGGTTSVPAVAGLATFTGLSVNTAGTGVVLTATRGALTAQSVAFNVSAGPPVLTLSTLAFPGTINTGIVTAGTPLAATFTIKDALGNAIPTAPISLATSLAGTTFTPNSGTTTTAGIFGSTVNFGAGGTGTVTATVSGVALAFPVLPAICSIGAAALGTPFAGTVSAGAENSCTLNNHRANIYRFSVPASPTATAVAISATGTGTFFPELAITPDPKTSSGTFLFGSTPLTLTNGPREWLVPSGSYLAHISSANGNAGSFTMTLANNGLGTPGCVVRVLPGLNAIYAGQSLAATDCSASDLVNNVFHYDAFYVLDTRPCTITMQAGFGVYIAVTNDDSDAIAVLDTPDTSGSVTLTRCALGPLGGPLMITLGAHDPNIAGPYTLQIAFTGAASPSGNLQ